jgi:hypothetical protein
MGMLDALVSNPKSLTAAELAQACGAEVVLVQRILACLTAYSAVIENNGQYSPNNTSRIFATAPGKATLHFIFSFMTPGWIQFGNEVKRRGYKSMTSGIDTPWSKIWSQPTDKTSWEILGDTPFRDDFALFCAAAYNIERKTWLDIYPIQERLVKGASTDPEAVFMVDVGGNVGSQAVALCERFPDAPGRVLVQDLAHTLPQHISHGIKPMEQDFFTPQKVQGARLYFFKQIMHDWGQERVVEILTHIRKAMKPGYSKVLIFDWILPEGDPGMFRASMGMNMMSFSGGEERTEARHRDYVEKAGLKVTGIWDPKDCVSEGIIECMLPE